MAAGTTALALSLAGRGWCDNQHGSFSLGRVTRLGPGEAASRWGPSCFRPSWRLGCIPAEEGLSLIVLGKSIVTARQRYVNIVLGKSLEGVLAVATEHSRYLGIAADLRARIRNGEWQPGANLPRLKDLAAECGANRDTVGRAVGVLESEGLVWAVPRRGTIVRHGLLRRRRVRGNLVKRNVATGEPGYSFPAASGQEVWHHHIPPAASVEKLADARLARMLGVAEGTPVLRRHRVTGPVTEPPFQICNSWIHPRGVQDAPEVADQEPGPGGWLYRLEKAGHGPISWLEYHRCRLPTKDEAGVLQIPAVLPVLEIVRVGRSGKDDEPIEVTEYIIPSDRVETVHSLHRDESAAWPWPEEQDITG
jgi:DNA-binding GntR family transcriptional regulator